MNDRLFFALIRSALWQTDIKDSNKVTSVNWLQEILTPAYNHTVIGLVAETSLRCMYKDTMCVESNVARQLVTQSKRVYDTHNRTLANVVTTLRKEGIEPVLLKGQSLARYYPKPELRQCGDIDLFVRKTDYEKACHIISAISNKGKNCHITSKHYSFYIDGVEVEIHRYTEKICNPFVNKEFQAWSNVELYANLPQITVGDTVISIPRINYNIVYVFCHIWNHFEISGIGIRQFCDLALLLHAEKDSIDVQNLKWNLQRFRLLKAWRITGAFMVKYLGLPAEEFPLYEKQVDSRTDNFCKIITLGGNFGRAKLGDTISNKNEKTIIKRKLKLQYFYAKHLFRIIPYTGSSILWRAIEHFCK